MRPVPYLVEVLALGAGLTVPLAADAALIITPINTTHPSGSFDIDLDQNGTNDFDLYIGIGTGGSYAAIKGLRLGTSISQAHPYATLFGPGAEIDASDFANADNYAYLYDGSVGPWATIGAHGFLGLRIPAINEPAGSLTGSLAPLDEEGNPEVGGYYYGWLEVTRGSLTVGQQGFQTTLNAPAPIPSQSQDVPEPGSLLLLVSGAAGIAAMRRRKQADGSAR